MRYALACSQSVKNADTAEEKGKPAPAKAGGMQASPEGRRSQIKRHIAVDSQGLPHALHITTANETDRNGALQAFLLHKDHLSNVKNVLSTMVAIVVPRRATKSKFCN